MSNNNSKLPRRSAESKIAAPASYALADQPSRTTEPWPIAELKPHPKQAEMFLDLPEHELQRLAENIDKNGLENPPEILPDGTLIKGHQRVRAAQSLGWTEIEVIVRHDLAEQGEAAVEEAFICDNLDRRQLQPIEIARCYRRLKVLERKSVWGLSQKEKGDLRDQLAKRFGVSGRTLDRYVRVLDTPQAVQDAAARNELPMIMAEQVAGLDRADREAIAMRIQNGEPPKTVVREYLHKGDGRHLRVEDALSSFANSLQRAQHDLGQRIGQLKRCQGVSDHLAVLQGGRGLIDQILEGIAT